MMQKNISVKTLKDSQKNVLSMAITLATVIVIFLFLGGLLYLYAESLNVSATGDKIFPVLAMEHMPPVVSVIFIIALISALFPSADGAITALTSTFCIDIIGIQRRADLNEAAQKKIRQRVHLTFAAIFLVFVLLFKWVNDPSMIGLLLKIAAYTYGPLLGLFTFGIITKRVVKDNLVPYVCIAAPIICFIIDKYQKSLLGSYEVGLELLIINGSITFLGLILISKKGNGQAAIAGLFFYSIARSKKVKRRSNESKTEILSVAAEMAAETKPVAGRGKKLT
jgi:Na+/proline symporter